MSNSVKIYIGWDSRFPLVGDVLKYSIDKNTGVRDVWNNLKDLSLPSLRISHKFNPKHDNKASTEFTYSRFLVPNIQRYEGIAVFIDNDMLCLGDLGALLNLINKTYKYVEDVPALICRKHDYKPEVGTKMYGVAQEPYPRKNWSSFMIMNCTKLLCWTKAVVEQADGARLHRFADVPDEEIVDIETIEPGWNDLTHMRPETKLLHYTEGGPWFDQYYNCPHADLWYKAFEEYFGYTHPNYPLWSNE